MSSAPLTRRCKHDLVSPAAFGRSGSFALCQVVQYLRIVDDELCSTNQWSRAAFLASGGHVGALWQHPSWKQEPPPHPHSQLQTSNCSCCRLQRWANSEIIEKCPVQVRPSEAIPLSADQTAILAAKLAGTWETRSLFNCLSVANHLLACWRLSSKWERLNLKSEEWKKPVCRAHFLGCAHHLGEVLRVGKKYPNWEAEMSSEMPPPTSWWPLGVSVALRISGLIRVVPEPSALSPGCGPFLM